MLFLFRSLDKITWGYLINRINNTLRWLQQPEEYQWQDRKWNCWGRIGGPAWPPLGKQLTGWALRSWMNPDSRQEGMGTYYIKLVSLLGIVVHTFANTRERQEEIWVPARNLPGAFWGLWEHTWFGSISRHSLWLSCSPWFPGMPCFASWLVSTSIPSWTMLTFSKFTILHTLRR